MYLLCLKQSLPKSFPINTLNQYMELASLSIKPGGREGAWTRWILPTLARQSSLTSQLTANLWHGLSSWSHRPGPRPRNLGFRLGLGRRGCSQIGTRRPSEVLSSSQGHLRSPTCRNHSYLAKTLPYNTAPTPTVGVQMHAVVSVRCDNSLIILTQIQIHLPTTTFF